MKLTPHFYLEEFTRSDTAARSGIDNTPGDVELVNLVYTAQFAEKIRKLCGGNVVHVSSGYRCKSLNDILPGAAKRSDHMLGLALDFTIPGFGTVEDVVQAIERSELNYLKLINEYNKWIHVSIHPMNIGPVGTAMDKRSGVPGYTKRKQIAEVTA